MSALTGDFSVVLQVSDSTVNRLAAAMHQNGIGEASTPTLPHVAYFRISGAAGDGERGSVAAQIGSPLIELIDGADDRFRARIPFRARFRPDPGSGPFADVINGTVTATYTIEGVDPHCPGWHDKAAEYVWVRVIPSSVTFDGAAYRESGELSLIPVDDEADVRRRVTAHLAALLAGPFEPRPHRVGAELRQWRSLSRGPGRSGVVLPTGPGRPDSVGELFLDGSDFALGIDSGYLVAGVRTKLAEMVGHRQDVHIHGDAGWGGGLEIDYHVALDSAAVSWLGGAPIGPPMGLVLVSLTGSGWATRLYRSGVYNVGSVSLDDLALTATADQYLTVRVDPAARKVLVTTAGPPAVTVAYHGPFDGRVKSAAHDAITARVTASLTPLLEQVQDELNSLTGAAWEQALVTMLRTVDPTASTRVNRATFRSDGLVLHGSVGLAHRHAPVVSFRKNEAGDGFDAIDCVVPGGRVDRFEWTWRWYTSPIGVAPGSPGAAATVDSFQLRRPRQAMSKYGLSTGVRTPLPGLDGQGQVCLRIIGTHVDHITGAQVPVQSVLDCAQFGYQFRLPVEVAPYSRVCDPLRAVRGEPAPEEGLVRVATTEASQSNTLVLYLGDRWDAEAAEALESGLRENPYSAALLVLILFTDGALATMSAPDREAAQRAAAEVAPVLLAEDIGQRWQPILGIGDERPAWRLLAPEDFVRWSHDGPLPAREVAAALDKHLVAALDPTPARLHPGTTIGERLPLDLGRGNCPPIPLGHATIGFTHLGARAPASGPRYTAVVVDGAQERELAALRDELGPDVAVIADPNGDLTRRAGIRMTPAVLTLDGAGRVVAGAEELRTDIEPQAAT
ncbi:MAG: hypothetical protein HOQ24_08555 [Mycobacteriaceae bacterium]|nr:hypothetical protein [Mycobacteriaceae bacterium]